MLTKEQRRAAVKAAADRVMPGIAAVLVADAAIAKAKAAVKCAYCGAKIGTSKSMLGGKLTDWHKPKRKAPTIGTGGWCLGSGNVLPTKENPHAL